jgi:NAD-dependent SIR2 family protein deacetylase
VQRAYALIDSADVLVVLGSSLTVMSGLRFVRYNAKLGRPVVIINRGPTRGDDLATLKIDGGCSETLADLP